MFLVHLNYNDSCMQMDAPYLIIEVRQISPPDYKPLNLLALTPYPQVSIFPL